MSAFVLYSAGMSLQMLTNLYKRLMINTNALSSIRMDCQCSKIFCEYAFLTNFRNMFLILLLHISECVGNGLMYISSPYLLTNRNGRKVIAQHSIVFVSIRGHPRGFANIRNMFLKFVRKAYSQLIYKQSQAILIDGNAFVVILRRL